MELAKNTQLYFQVQWRNFTEFCQTLVHYYPRFSFLKTDLALRLHYLLKSPYRISKEFLSKRNASNVDAYGETPLRTMELIAKECEIKPTDTLFELGCGRGRTCFWLHHFIGCRTVGIEIIPQFVTKAKEVANLCQLDKMEFRCENMLDSDLSKATVIYLYGTCLDENDIKTIINKIEKLPAGTKVISVSYPLTDYANTSFLEVMKVFPAQFTWGNTEVYLQYIK